MGQAAPAPAQPAQEGWKCICGAVNKGKFCPECGDLFDEDDVQ